MEVSDRISFCEEKNTFLFFSLIHIPTGKNITFQRLFSTNLQVFWTKLVSVHVDGGQEDGFHLIVPQLIRWQMGSNQDL